MLITIKSLKQQKNTKITLLLKCCLVSSVASEQLLRVTAQDLQAQGDAVDPAARVDTEVAAEQGGIEHRGSLLVWLMVSCEDLRVDRGGERNDR